MKKHMTLSFFTALLLGLAPLGSASQHEGPKQETTTTTGKDAHRGIADAADAVKDYTAEQRDVAVKKAKAALDDLDARINVLEDRIDRNWDTMDRTARMHARSTLKALHEQRVRVAEWYGGLKNSTANVWGQTKAGFTGAYERLRHGWEKAEQEYKENGKK